VQRDAVVGVVGDDDVVADLLHLLLQRRVVSEDSVVDLHVVLAGREVGDVIVAEVHHAVGFGEDERVIAKTTGQLVIAAVTVQDVVAVIADDRVGTVGAIDVLDVGDRALGTVLVVEWAAVVDDVLHEVHIYPSRMIVVRRLGAAGGGDRIDVAAAVEACVAVVAEQGVVAVAALEDVDAATTMDDVVA